MKKLILFVYSFLYFTLFDIASYIWNGREYRMLREDSFYYNIDNHIRVNNFYGMIDDIFYLSKWDALFKRNPWNSKEYENRY